MLGPSLVVQELRLHLPVQGVWAWSLVRSWLHTFLVAKTPKHKTKEIYNNQDFKNGPHEKIL